MPCCTSHCGIDTSLSRVQLCHSKHTLTARHQFLLAWAGCTSLPSFASTGPHLHTTLSRFVEHAGRKCYSIDRSLAFLRTSYRECLTSTRSRSLASPATAISATCPPDCQWMSTGTETRLRSCRIAPVLSQTRSCRSGHSPFASRALSHGQRLSTPAYCRELLHQLSSSVVLARSRAVSTLRLRH